MREDTLNERFEAANREFAATFFWKVRLLNAGLRHYGSGEFYEDLYGTAREYGLLPHALWAYFRQRHLPRG